MPAQVPFTHPLDADEFMAVLWPMLNDNLEALASSFYSDDESEPAVRFPFQLRANMGGTTGPYFCISNEAADDWFFVAELDSADAQPPVFALGLSVTKDTEGTAGANKITFSVQVKDVRGGASAATIAGRRLVTLIVATTSYGAPGGTQTLAVVTGTLIATLASGTVLLVETDATGLAEVTVEVSGAGDRYVRASVGHGKAFELQGTWA